MTPALASTRRKWRDYRGSAHAWSAVRDLGMQRSLCGYLARDARLAKPSGPCCTLCVLVADENFPVTPRSRVSESIARLQDVRKTYDHVRRAMELLKATTLDPASCDEALTKLASVQTDLIAMFRLERIGTGYTVDDGSLGDADAGATARTV